MKTENKQINQPKEDELKTFALHLLTEFDVRKRASSQKYVRYHTVKAKNSKDAFDQLLKIYCNHQCVGSFPKGYKIDELI